MNTQKSKFQPRLLRAAIVVSSCIGVSGMLSSCSSNEELEDRLDERNDKYQNLQNRRQIRQDARQERTDAWFDRAMH